MLFHLPSCLFTCSCPVMFKVVYHSCRTNILSNIPFPSSVLSAHSQPLPFISCEPHICDTAWVGYLHSKLLVLLSPSVREKRCT